MFSASSSSGACDTSPTDRAPIKQMQTARFDSEHWELFGPVISDEVHGRPRPCFDAVPAVMGTTLQRLTIGVAGFCSLSLTELIWFCDRAVGRVTRSADRCDRRAGPRQPASAKRPRTRARRKGWQVLRIECQPIGRPRCAGHFRKWRDWALCCVVLGHDADNALGNAHETPQWIRQQGFRTLRLVTAWYHMPCSLLV